ncbi:DUF4190 domain-containing protein [Streptomyces sp. NPDC048191]|uniref:DUF4190 domain-containing protein n=1 Tax=Streptomyces sp. NPDC048191 TaxID=3155484 RepID=UPI0033F0FD69
MSDEVPQSTPQENRPAGEGPTSPWVSLDKQGTAPAQDAIPESGPAAAPSGDHVHYQPTLTSLPASTGEPAPADAAPSAWAPPVPPAPDPFTPPAANPFAPPAADPFAPAAANPFAPPAATPPAHPYAPPAGPANPYAPPPAAQASSYAPPAAPHGGPQPVPPPPIAPDGPGQVPYGYPGTPSAYGYPAQPQQPYGYGWPGMQPVPSNGMGIASLVLGILAAICFLAWPLALVMGILAIIFGALGRGKAKRGEATNPGQALAGLICGVAGIVLVLVFFAFVIASSA